MHPHHNGQHASRKRLAVVARVSTLDQERYGTSLEDQARKGELLAQLHGLVVVDSRAYQGDESGALPLQARPIMQRLLADARARRFDAVCFHKIDRIARRLKYILDIWDQLDEAGVTVYIVEPAIDTSDMMGRLLRNVLGTIAEFERDLILSRTSGGTEREMAKGAVYLPRGKYGYQYVPRDRAQGTLPHVVPHPEHARVVQRMFALRRARWSHVRIATALTAEGVPSPAAVARHKRGGKRWHESTVQAIIADRTYMGEGAWGKTTYKLTKNGKRARMALPEGRVPTPVAYPALVTPEEWHAAQASPQPCAVRADADDYLFYGGMARCAAHGGSMSGSRTGKGRRYYRCTQRLYPGGRTSHGVPAEDLETKVWAAIYEAMTDETRMAEAAQRMAREAEEAMEGIARRRSVILARLEDLDRQVQWIFTQLREAGATAVEIALQLTLIRDEQARLRAEEEPLAAQMALCQADLPRAEHVQSMCRDFVMAAQGADARTKRALLDAVECSVLVDGDRFRIEGVLSVLGLEGVIGAHSTVSPSRSGAVRAIPFALLGVLASQAPVRKESAQR